MVPLVPLVLVTFAHASEKRILVVIDVQKCFLPDQGDGFAGSLASSDEHADTVVANANRFRDDSGFDQVFLTMDSHPMDHISFIKTHIPNDPETTFPKVVPTLCFRGETEEESGCCPNIFKDDEIARNSPLAEEPWCVEMFEKYESGSVDGFTEASQLLWPQHCVFRSPGDTAKGWEAPFNLDPFDEDEIVIKKGTRKFIDSYSGFGDNEGYGVTELGKDIRIISQRDGGDEEDVHLYLAGIATNICVKFSLLHALQKHYATITLVTDATAATVS